METYRLEREWLKEEELFAIASALQSVSSMYEPFLTAQPIKKSNTLYLSNLLKHLSTKQKNGLLT